MYKGNSFCRHATACPYNGRRIFNCTILKRTLLTPIAIGAIFTIAGLYGCKPSEKHYREAYETTVKARHAGEDEYLDSLTKVSMKTGGRPAIMHVGDQTLEYRVEWIRPATDSKNADKLQQTTAGPAKPYCIMVGQFKQRFNANEMRQRLQNEGYTHAMVFRNSEPRYFVAADTVSSPEAALQMLDSVKKDSRLILKPPFPSVMQPAQRSY